MVRGSWLRSPLRWLMRLALAALAAVNSAVAGVVALVPLAWWAAGVVLGVIVGGVAMAVAWYTADPAFGPDRHPADSASPALVDDCDAQPPMHSDGGGLHPGGLVPSDGGDPTHQPQLPSRDEDAPEHPDDASDSPRGFGSLELHLDGNVDLRHVRYTVTYRPDPEHPQQPVYLRRAVYDSGRVQLLSAAQLQADPAAYGWGLQPPARLCEPGLGLSQAQPSCQGVVRVSARLRCLRGGVARLRVYATPQAPPIDAGGQAAEQPLDHAVSAAASLRLRNAFFAVLAAADWQHAALYRIEQSPIHRDRFSAQWLPLAASFGDESPVFPQRIQRLELARDGSRVYLAGRHEVYEWLGEPGRVRLLRDFGEAAGVLGMTVTDRGMCVARVADERGALVCRLQAGDWSAARAFANQVRPPYEIASCGDSVLAVERQSGQPRPLLGAYLRQTLPNPLLPASAAVVTLHPSWNGGRRTRSLLPVWCQPGRQEFVLAGSFEPGPAGFAPVAASLRDDGTDWVQMGRPFGTTGPDGHAQAHAVAWKHPSAPLVRIFSFSQGLVATDFDLLRRRMLARQDLDVPQGWAPDGGLALLTDEGDTRYLVASGWPKADRRASMLFLRMDRFGAAPQLVWQLDFSAELSRFSLQPGQGFVRRLTTNTVTLEPVDPDLHDDDA